MQSNEAENKPSPNRYKLPWWKRSWLVNRELQMRFASNVVVVGFISSLSTCGILLWALWSFNIWQGQRLPAPVLALMVALLLINMSGIYVSTILSTHKIVGPIFNLLRQFNQLGNGKFNAFARFRESDEIHYLARRFNELVLKLRTRNDFIFNNVETALKAMEQNDLDNAKRNLQILLDMKRREEGSSNF